MKIDYNLTSIIPNEKLIISYISFVLFQLNCDTTQQIKYKNDNTF